MNAMKNEMGPFCPKYHRGVELIGRRWTGAILRALLSGISRFSEI
ncbi:MAG: MarR family transcriptional regulator, partial [Chloroflexi bacterium]